MLSRAGLEPGDRLLDLGCGYGVVGLAAAKVIGADNVVMVDRDPAAVVCSRKNADANGLPGVTIVESDGFAALRGQRFTVILCNPPFHSDFSVARRLIAGAHRHLVMGGRCLFVVKRLLWYERKFRAVFGGVQVERVGSYYVLKAEKRSETIPRRLRLRRTTRKHEQKTARPRRGRKPPAPVP